MGPPSWVSWSHGFAWTSLTYPRPSNPVLLPSRDLAPFRKALFSQPVVTLCRTVIASVHSFGISRRPLIPLFFFPPCHACQPACQYRNCAGPRKFTLRYHAAVPRRSASLLDQSIQCKQGWPSFSWVAIKCKGHPPRSPLRRKTPFLPFLVSAPCTLILSKRRHKPPKRLSTSLQVELLPRRHHPPPD